MKNELLTIGPFTLYGYGLMVGVGISAAYVTAVVRARRKGFDTARLSGLFVWCLAWGIAGAKLFYLLLHLPALFQNAAILRNIGSGFVFYGALFGGVCAGLWYGRKHQLRLWEWADLLAPSLALAQGFGRIGCFLAGCCYGVETPGLFHVVFTESAYAPNGVPLVPIQLVASGGDFLLFWFLIRRLGQNARPGLTAGAYMLLYSAGRFVLEFFRGDMQRGFIGPLSVSQVLSVAVFIAGLAILAIKQKTGKSNKVTPAR